MRSLITNVRGLQTPSGRRICLSPVASQSLRPASSPSRVLRPPVARALTVPLSKREVEAQLKQSGHLPSGEPLSRRYYQLIQTIGQKEGFGKQFKAEQLRRVTDIIENRRRKIAEAAERQIILLPTQTTSKLNILNPAERAWLRYAAERFTPYVSAIFDHQSLPGAPQKNYLKELLGKDSASFAHLAKNRDTNLPLLRPAYIPKDVPSPEQYACSVPWFPDRPNYSGMWPKDLTPSELRFLRRRYKKSDPVLLPYTIVERLSPEQARRIAQDGRIRNKEGKAMEWIVEGLHGRRYRVTNIVFHEAYRDNFHALAVELRKSAQITAKGSRLDPTFRRYLIRMASAISRGDFEGWLKADMEQRKGNLFFTFFPHEGYWADNIKFPFSYETGIREWAAVKEVAKNADIIQALEAEALATANRLGVKKITKPFDPASLGDMVQIVRIFQKGGFMSAFPNGEVLGHDYPKVRYRSVSGHRNVVMLDVAVANSLGDRKAMRALFPDEIVKLMTSEAVQAFTVWHEARHGILANRLDTIMRNGQEMGEVYDQLWGAVAEPGADFGSFRAALLLHERGRISREEMLGILYYGVFRAVKQLPRKEQALAKGFPEDNPHGAGRVIYVCHMLTREKRVIRFGKNGKLEVDIDELVKAIKELDQRYVELGLTGSKEDYLKFFRSYVRALSGEFVKQVHRKIGPLNRVLLTDRPGDQIARQLIAA